MMVAKSWGTQISGPILAIVSIGLAVVSGVYAQDPSIGIHIVKVTAWITGVLAFLLIFVAQYDIWKLEHEAREAAEAKNLKPEIKGRLYNFDVGIRGSGSDGENFNSSAEVSFIIEVCNHRSVATNIRGLSFDESTIGHGIHIYGITMSGAPQRLEYGILVRFAGQLSIIAERPKPSVQGYWPDRVEMPLEGLVAVLTDGLNEKHRLAVEGAIVF